MGVEAVQSIGGISTLALHGYVKVINGIGDVSVVEYAPVNTEAIYVPNGCSTYIVNPASALTSIAIFMPSVPLSGQLVTVILLQAITSTLYVTTQPGQAIMGWTAGAFGPGYFTFQYWRGTWYRRG